MLELFIFCAFRYTEPHFQFLLFKGSVLTAKITELPGWGSKSAGNLLKTVQVVAARGVSLHQYIFSLGIRHVGSFNSKVLASTYGTVTAFLDALTNANGGDDNAFYQLTGTTSEDGVKGMGPAIIASLYAFSRESALIVAAEKLSKAVKINDDVTMIEQSDGPLMGLSVVFTGTLPGSMTRSQAQELAKAMGAKSTPSAVSKSTNLVIEGDGGGRKIEKAKDFGIRVMKSSEWVEIVEEFMSYGAT